MKIQCDVCHKDEAALFCVADEASLCAACDHRVHHANKLAGKHQRFTLHHPSPKQAPLCDICQERRAFLFCQQDRAILCRECDIPIHKANEHTQKHTRFLLTGVKISPTSALYSESNPSNSAESDSSSVISNASNPVSNHAKFQDSNIHHNCTPSTSKGTTLQRSPDKTSGNTISEYLIEMLPGWHVEDFLDSPSPYGFSKNGGNESQPFLEEDEGFQSNINGELLTTEKMGFWVPQVSPPLHYQSYQSPFGLPNGEFSSKSSRNMNQVDNSFAVPQIKGSKKSTTFW